MPGIATCTGARVLERLELQPVGRKADGTSVLEQSLAIGRHEVCEATTSP